MARDKKVISAYLDNCYRVAVVWECSITGKQKEQKLSKVTEEISLWLVPEASVYKNNCVVMRKKNVRRSQIPLVVFSESESGFVERAS